MKSTAKPIERFHYLDSARGLAAMSVITWHFITAFFDYKTRSLVISSPIRVFWYGEPDMLFFFIHSGFILSYAYLGNNKPFTFVNYIRFLIERIFRIYPLFLFILLVSYFMVNSFFPIGTGSFTSDHIKSFWRGGYGLSDVLKQGILFIRIPDEANLRLIPQDWTLTVEVLVGTLIPFLGFVVKKFKWLYWPVVLITIKLLHFNTYLFEFAIGVFLFFNWNTIAETWKRFGRFLKITITCVAALLWSCFFQFPAIFSSENIFISQSLDRIALVTGCSLIFCIIISSVHVQKILSHPLFVKIGRICYSIYLVHILLLICFGDLIMQYLSSFSSSNMLNLSISYIVYITLTVLISFFTFSFIERPANKLGKFIGRSCESIMKNKNNAIFQKNLET